MPSSCCFLGSPNVFSRSVGDWRQQCLQSLSSSCCILSNPNVFFPRSIGDWRAAMSILPSSCCILGSPTVFSESVGDWGTAVVSCVAPAFFFLDQLGIGEQQCPHCPACILSSHNVFFFLFLKSVGNWGQQCSHCPAAVVSWAAPAFFSQVNWGLEPWRTAMSKLPSSCCILGIVGNPHCFYFLVSWGLGDRNTPQLLYLEQPKLFLFLGLLGTGGHKYPAAAVSPAVAIARNLCATQLADYIPPSRVPALPLLGQWLVDFSH